MKKTYIGGSRRLLTGRDDGCR